MATTARVEAIERATGRGWDDWLAYFERIGAANLSHHEIATVLIGELEGTVDNVGWWAQAAAVAYEQHTGRRIPGQRPDGTFQTSVSRSTPLGMEPLIEAWTAFAAKDAEVLGLIAAEPRVSGTANRITWRTKGRDGTSITIISEPKKDATSALVVQLLGTATLDANEASKRTWATIVDRFAGSHFARARDRGPGDRHG